MAICYRRISTSVYTKKTNELVSPSFLLFQFNLNGIIVFEVGLFTIINLLIIIFVLFLITLGNPDILKTKEFARVVWMDKCCFTKKEILKLPFTKSILRKSKDLVYHPVLFVTHCVICLVTTLVTICF